MVDLSRGYGGVDVRVLAMARALHGRRPYDVAVMAGSPLDTRLRDEGLNVLALPGHKFDPRQVGRLRRLIVAGDYGVVDAHNVQSQLWGLWAARRARVPVLVSSVHTAYGHAVPPPANRLQEQVLRANLRWGARFVTVSRTIVDYLNGLGVPSERVDLIYNGIDLTAYRATAVSGDIRAAFGWPPEATLLVVVGRLEWQKGHGFLLDALPAVVDAVPSLRCLFVGEGRLRGELARQVREAGLAEHVAFAGFRDDVAAILAQSDIFCLPSRTEGLPFAMLEAAALRRPLLLSDVDGIGELFQHEATAYLVPSGDITALAAGIRRLIDDPSLARALGGAAHDFVARRLNPATMVEATLAVYDRP